MDLEKGYLFKLTSAGVLPFNKPDGKKIYFNRVDLETWAMSNRHSGSGERATKAVTYIAFKKGR